MSGAVPITHHPQAQLRPDPARVIGRLFLPGEELPDGRSRTGAVVARVLALPEADVEQLAAQVCADFADRFYDFAGALDRHAWLVSSHLGTAPPMSAARRLILGATFTAGYAVEGAALCNPSAVLHPDQSGLEAGQARVAVSLRAIGEGHISSLGFVTALVGPGPRWVFEPRQLPAVAGVSTVAHWRRSHLRAVLADRGRIDGLAHNVLGTLPDPFTGVDLEQSLAGVHQDLLTGPGGPATVDLLRHVVASAYQVDFAADVELGQRVLFPATAEESNGMEDARFVRFVSAGGTGGDGGADGAVEYRATYTAYDGRHIAPRLLTSPDLRTFRAQRMAGPAARNKGMALFPRLIGGRHASLCRSDGESTSLAWSRDGLVWDDPQPVQAPQEAWELLQIGNCGPPMETDRGWLVLTHGVGPMRTYAIGAILLDLHDPATVLARLRRPLLVGAADERDGYVPNVVYSCGALIHERRLWIPYGIADAWIGVASACVDEVIDAMSPGA